MVDIDGLHLEAVALQRRLGFVAKMTANPRVNDDFHGVSCPCQDSYGDAALIKGSLPRAVNRAANHLTGVSSMVKKTAKIPSNCFTADIG